MFKTRVTEILGIEYPIIAGTMQALSRAELVAAAANAGVLGIIPSATFGSKEELRDEIRKVKSLTDNPFGVNVNLFPMLMPVSIEEYMDTVIEEGVKVIETSGRSPAPYVERIKSGGGIPELLSEWGQTWWRLWALSAEATPVPRRSPA